MIIRGYKDKTAKTPANRGHGEREREAINRGPILRVPLPVPGNK